MKLRNRNVSAATIVACVAALAWAAPSLAGDKGDDSSMNKGSTGADLGDKAKKDVDQLGDKAKSKADQAAKGIHANDSAIHGKALDHLPAKCDTVAYVDMNGFANAGPVEANKELLRDRARDIVSGLSEGKFADATKATKRIVSQLESKGISWKDVDEIGACGSPKGLDMITLSGHFADKKLVPSLISSGQTKAEDHIVKLDKNGKTYAKLDVGGRTYFAYQVAPNVLGIAPDTKTLDKANKPSVSMKQRTGDEGNLAYFSTKLEDGRTVTSSFSPLASAHVLTTTVKSGPKMSFDPQKDKQAMQDALDRWASRLRETPLQPLADAVDNTPVTVTKNEIRMRTVMANQDLKNALANSAKSPRSDWNALFQAESPEGIGGGPDQQKSDEQMKQKSDQQMKQKSDHDKTKDQKKMQPGQGGGPSLPGQDQGQDQPSEPIENPYE